MKRSQGFTLIELMITIAIFSLMVTMGAQLTTSWVNSAQQRDAAGLLKQGISRAKATALRNPGGALNSWPAAALCRSGQVLKLYSISDQASINCSSTSNILWQTNLPSAATLQAGGTDISCVAFNSRGLPVNGSNACATSTISVTVGSESAVDVEII